MKKIINWANRNMLTMVGGLAMIVGLTSACRYTSWYFGQPKCPEHLLK